MTATDGESPRVLVYLSSCRIGPHMGKAHRGRDRACDCPCHAHNRNNERNPWWSRRKDAS